VFLSHRNSATAVRVADFSSEAEEMTGNSSVSAFCSTDYFPNYKMMSRCTRSTKPSST